MARTLAGLAGQELVELALNGGTDTSDLLGGFEQLEPGRRLQVSCPMLDRAPCKGTSAHLGALVPAHLCLSPCMLTKGACLSWDATSHDPVLRYCPEAIWSSFGICQMQGCFRTVASHV